MDRLSVLSIWSIFYLSSTVSILSYLSYLSIYIGIGSIYIFTKFQNFDVINILVNNFFAKSNLQYTKVVEDIISVYLKNEPTSTSINFKELTAWKNFIKENKLEGWINAYQTEADLNKEIQQGKPTTIRQLYDVFKTPTFYLLDANKKIIAKNLSIEQFNDFLVNSSNKKERK